MGEVVTGRVHQIEMALGGRAAIIDAIQSDPPLTLGAARILRCPISFDTPDLLTGAPLFQPTVGDILLTAWVEVETAWDGTTPKADVGTFQENSVGLFGRLGSAVDLTAPDLELGGPGDGILGGSFGTTLGFSGIIGQGSYRVTPARFVDTYQPLGPVKAVVSQNGQQGGADPGSTQGHATFYFVVLAGA